MKQQVPALILYARRWTNSHAAAEDVVQEGFLRLWRTDKGSEPNAEYYVPRLYLAVKRAALDALRSEKRRRTREEKATGPQPDFSEFGYPDSERHTQLRRALDRLNDEQREVLVMKIWGELTFKMIGEALGISINTAASRYRYALEALRQHLSKEELTYG